ncbi:ATP-binding protein [Streptomyces sp. NPDC050418]|uniref:ATP-binding protein n=1 Tax=Streptomyces sp. NPDC050418 TaxID=3365612 RepID=UPI0037A77672
MPTLIPLPSPPAAPTPETLAYSLTLPAALSSPGLARTASRTFLEAHALHDLTDPALLALTELAACACKFTAAPRIYVSLRYRDASLRITLYDDDPVPSSPPLARARASRRRASLHLLNCVIRTCRGTWGITEAEDPTPGTRMWASLPHTAAYATA